MIEHIKPNALLLAACCGFFSAASIAQLSPKFPPCTSGGAVAVEAPGRPALNTYPWGTLFYQQLGSPSIQYSPGKCDIRTDFAPNLPQGTLGFMRAELPDVFSPDATLPTVSRFTISVSPEGISTAGNWVDVYRLTLSDGHSMVLRKKLDVPVSDPSPPLYYLEWVLEYPAGSQKTLTAEHVFMRIPQGSTVTPIEVSWRHSIGQSGTPLDVNVDVALSYGNGGNLTVGFIGRRALFMDAGVFGYSAASVPPPNGFDLKNTNYCGPPAITCPTQFANGLF